MMNCSTLLASVCSRRLSIVIPLLLALLLTGCSQLVFKQDVQQGNVLDEDTVSELALGMTKRQVAVLLGTPAVRSPFHQDRWDYFYSFARGGAKPDQRLMTLHFEDDRLASISGSALDLDSPVARALRALQTEYEDAVIQDLDPINPSGQP